MHSLHLRCQPGELEQVSLALWEAGTAGIHEEDRGDHIQLVAGFEDFVNRDELTCQFSNKFPCWEKEEEIDWVLATQEAWPARLIGKRIFLAPVWNKDATPEGSVRVVHNPGLASGTGEHPCTQLALKSLEQCVRMSHVVVDVGTGSGVLCVAARQLGARLALGLDLDAGALQVARENYVLNQLAPALAVGTADCVAAETADVVVANISATVLIALADELIRVAKPNGKLILTGFPESELAAVCQMFGDGEVIELNQWRCVTLIS